MIEISEKLMTFLRSKDTMVLATLGPENVPHAATVYFYVDDKLDFYCAVKSASQKYSNILAHEGGSIVVGVKDEPVTVQASGTIGVIDNPEKKTKLFAKIIKLDGKGNKHWPALMYMPESSLKILKFTPKWMRMYDARDAMDKGFESDIVFTQILPKE